MSQGLTGAVSGAAARAASTASAATITLPAAPLVATYPISGTTTITSITAGAAGRIAILEFASAACSVTNGSNLKLASNYVSTLLGTLTLESDGTNWVELGRNLPRLVTAANLLVAGPASGAAATETARALVLADLPAVPSCRAYHNANQSIADSTQTALAFNSERWDTDTIHDLVTNNTRLTCKTAGKYVITGHVNFDVNATGVRAVYIVFNTTAQLAAQQQMAVTTASRATGLSIATAYDLAVNDYVELQVRQESTVSLNVLSNGNYSPEFTMTRSGA